MKIQFIKPPSPTEEQREALDVALYLITQEKRKIAAFDWWFTIGVNTHTLREDDTGCWLLRRVGIPILKERAFPSPLEAIEYARTEYDSEH